MRKFIFAFLLWVPLMILSAETYAQCSMCRRVAETSQTNGTRKGQGLNKGILYLLSIPYILGGIGIYAWYRNKSKG